METQFSPQITSEAAALSLEHLSHCSEDFGPLQRGRGNRSVTGGSRGLGAVRDGTQEGRALPVRPPPPDAFPGGTASLQTHDVLMLEVTELGGREGWHRLGFLVTSNRS